MSSKFYSSSKRELKILNALHGKASERAGNQKFINKNVMLGPGVTHSIHCSVLSVLILIVVVAFSSCLVIALQKKHESASSNKLLHHSLCVPF